MGHLWQPVDNTWKSFEDKLNTIRGIPMELRVLMAQFLQSIYEAARITEDTPTDLDRWFWANDAPTNGSFTLSNRQTYLLLLEDHEK